MAERIDTVVIGGGQAGLSTSYHLTEQKREHVVLEKDRVRESWKSKKWDSFTLVTPNWQLRLPGFAYDGEDPDDFLTRDEVAQYVDDFAAMFDPPVRLGVEASSIEKGYNGGGLKVKANAGELEADNVVVASGTFQRPNIPDFSQQISPDVVQMHSSLYRNPESLPAGAVLVVGGGQSGCQIAEELYQSGRKVSLCTSNTRRAPRRYRGKDFTWWLDKMGVIDDTVDDLDSPEEDQPELRAGYEVERITDLDLKAAGIKTIIWATGYDFDYSWVKFPIWDEFGYPVQERGVTQAPGLYFSGLHWIHTLKSGLFIGIGDDTAHVVEHIEGR